MLLFVLAMSKVVPLSLQEELVSGEAPAEPTSPFAAASGKGFTTDDLITQLSVGLKQVIIVYLLYATNVSCRV